MFVYLLSIGDANVQICRCVAVTDGDFRCVLCTAIFSTERLSCAPGDSVAGLTFPVMMSAFDLVDKNVFFISISS